MLYIGGECFFSAQNRIFSKESVVYGASAGWQARFDATGVALRLSMPVGTVSTMRSFAFRQGK